MNILSSRVVASRIASGTVPRPPRLISVTLLLLVALWPIGWITTRDEFGESASAPAIALHACLVILGVGFSYRTNVEIDNKDFIERLLLFSPSVALKVIALTIAAFTCLIGTSVILVYMPTSIYRVREAYFRWSDVLAQGAAMLLISRSFVRLRHKTTVPKAL